MSARLVIRAYGLVLLAGWRWFSASEVRAEEPQEIRHGLKAEFYAGRNFEKLILERIEPNVEYFFGHYSSPAEDVPVDDFSIRWSGWIRAPRDGRYNLIFHCNDGVRVWVDGQQIVDEWKGGVFTFKASVELTEKPQSIRIEYFEATGDAKIAMLWQATGATVPCPVPPEAFSPDEASAQANPRKELDDKTGLVAEYFDTKFTRKLRVGRVSRLEAMWSDGAPLWGVPPNAGARYTGFLVPPVTGRYKLVAAADNFVRLWIDDKPVLGNEFRQRETAFVDLEANKPYPIRVHFVDTTGWGGYYLHWTPPNCSQEVSIPPECLFQTERAISKNKKGKD